MILPRRKTYLDIPISLKCFRLQCRLLVFFVFYLNIKCTKLVSVTHVLSTLKEKRFFLVSVLPRTHLYWKYRERILENPKRANIQITKWQDDFWKFFFPRSKYSARRFRNPIVFSSRQISRTLNLFFCSKVKHFLDIFLWSLNFLLLLLNKSIYFCGILYLRFLEKAKEIWININE